MRRQDWRLYLQLGAGTMTQLKGDGGGGGAGGVEEFSLSGCLMCLACLVALSIGLQLLLLQHVA